MVNSSRVVTDVVGNIIYYNEQNQYHREDGPAIEYKNGSKEWWINNKLHREDGPAIDRYFDFVDNKIWYKYWYKNGKRHREDGPACELANGSKYFYLDDKQYSEEEYYRVIKLLFLI